MGHADDVRVVACSGEGAVHVMDHFTYIFIPDGEHVSIGKCKCGFEGPRRRGLEKAEADCSEHEAREQVRSELQALR